MRLLSKTFFPVLCHGAIAVALMLCPSAFAQQIQNGNMEGGFTNGVANGWSSWKSNNYPEGGFAEGTDYYQSPTHSQKFILNRSDYAPKEVAICQIVNAAAGGTYTFSLKLRSWVEGGENYSGEHINTYMGLDPTGGTNRFSVDVEWHEMSNQRNTWVNESFQVTAESCWVTIWIRGVRKFPYGGYGGAAWIDDVSVSGPTPDPTWTFTPTVTATNTPPIPVGSELVNNGDFESGFTGGLANGWSNWSTVGTGYWKPSTLVGKAGGGNYWNVTGWYEDMVDMQPKTILLGCGYGASDNFAYEADLDDTVIVGREHIDGYMGEIYDGDYEAVAEWLADKYEQEAAYHPRIDAWLGVNEPDWGTDAHWQRTIQFETYLTQLMHQRGLKTCVLNLATGNPGDIDRILWCKDLLEIADYLGYHCYGGPTDLLMITPYIEEENLDDPYDFALRARRFAEMYRNRGWKFPPVIYTEGTTWCAWKADPAPPEAEDVRDDLINFIPFMNQDRWCTGLTIFVVGGSGAWADFDITNEGIAEPVGEANNDDPADKTSGLYSQQFGVGTLHCLDNDCDHDGIFTGGVVQQITGLATNETYRLGFDFKWEHANGPAQLSFQYGLDWTGQTGNGNAGTINWSSDLIALYDLPHDIFQHHYDMFEAQASTVSVWFKSNQNLANVSYRINIDTVSLQQVSGEPPPTPTTGPPATATPTPETGPGLLNGDMEGGFTSGVANEWTSYVTNGSPTFSDGTDQKHGGAHSQKIVYPQPSGAGYAGIYQVVSCSSSQNGTLTAWKYDQLSGGDPYALVCRLGYDLSGGTNPQAGSVVWSEFSCTPHQTWLSKQVQFTTTGSSVTVFVEAWHKGWGGTHTAWLDDVTLDGIGGPPPPTETPLDTPTPTPTPPSGGGLENGDMEGGFTGGVANDWTAYITNGNPTFSDGTDQKHGGAHSQKIVYPQPSGAGYAGIYQVVSCSSSQNGTLTAWKYDQLSGGDPYALVCRLGYDLTGGTNPQAGSVVWAEFNCTPHQTWLSKQVQFTTTGSSVTVFVEAWHKGWGGTHTAWLDDVTLDGVGGPPEPTSTPTSTPVPGQGLQNGDMEGGFTGGVANNWTNYVTNGSPTFSDGTDQKHGGAHSQKIVYPQPSGQGFAGIYQVVTCSSGKNATLTAWKYDQLSGGDPYALVCRLGYDLSGGTDPQGASVVWAEFDCTPHQTWLSKQVQFTTTGSSVTVFLEAWHKSWGGTHTAWFDDATLEGL